ncbi:hypothetical protein ABW20_dc0105655 [Dactylellina cionopaga]|nr:hypothetical protein ABW20_dc0105655 [Dactylellina cionopaga]
MITHRISGGWAGKRIAAIGRKAYAPASISYEPQIHGKPTRLHVPSKYIVYSAYLDAVFKNFDRRELALGERIVEPDVFDKVIDVVRFIVFGTITTEDDCAVQRKSYIIRNLSKKHYIRCKKAADFRDYLRISNFGRQNPDLQNLTVEDAAIFAFAMEVMWGGEGKEGEWAGDNFDITEEDQEFDREEWEDVSDDILEGSKRRIQCY